MSSAASDVYKRQIQESTSRAVEGKTLRKRKSNLLTGTGGTNRKRDHHVNVHSHTREKTAHGSVLDWCAERVVGIPNESHLTQSAAFEKAIHGLRVRTFLLPVNVDL